MNFFERFDFGGFSANRDGPTLTGGEIKIQENLDKLKELDELENRKKEIEGHFHTGDVRPGDSATLAQLGAQIALIKMELKAKGHKI